MSHPTRSEGDESLSTTVSPRAFAPARSMSVAARVRRIYRRDGASGVLAALGRRLDVFFRLPADVIFMLLTSPFFGAATGRQHGIGFLTKVGILRRFLYNAHRIKGASNWKEHLLMATELLNTPADVDGAVVECGSFDGLSAANISIVCKLCRRRLYVCDSFEGLPEPRAGEGLTLIPHRSQHYEFRKGQYLGTLETVRSNILRFGELEVCEFVSGYFDATLPGFQASIVLVFEDADLRSSVETCLKHLWGKLRNGGIFFCHEPWSRQVVELFYDRGWWRENFNCDPPGFYGSGTGVPLGMSSGSGIGFARKIDVETYLRESTLRVGQ